MANIQSAPTYTATNCSTSYKLYSSLSLFAKHAIPDAQSWFSQLKDAVEKDGVRILEYAQPSDRTHQFLVSSKPIVSPAMIIKSVKGRLQHAIRDEAPQSFHRNYSIKSVGPASCEVVENYVATQLEHHNLGDEELQRQFMSYQIHANDIDLNAVRRSNHGEFIYNLHLVLTHQDRWNEINDEILRSVRDAITKTADARGHLLSEAGIVPDHHHFALGCGVTESPMDVGLAYLNDLAAVYSNAPVFLYGFFVGTFGPFDLNAVRIANDNVWS